MTNFTQVKIVRATSTHEPSQELSKSTMKRERTDDHQEQEERNKPMAKGSAHGFKCTNCQKEYSGSHPWHNPQGTESYICAPCQHKIWGWKTPYGF